MKKPSHIHQVFDLSPAGMRVGGVNVTVLLQDADYNTIGSVADVLNIEDMRAAVAAWDAAWGEKVAAVETKTAEAKKVSFAVQVENRYGVWVYLGEGGRSLTKDSDLAARYDTVQAADKAVMKSLAVGAKPWQVTVLGA